MSGPAVEQAQQAYLEKAKAIQALESERKSTILKRQQLEAQLTENTLVKKELDLLEADAVVYKLIGPALVKQDLEESKSTVSKRLEYITGEIDRSTAQLKDSDKKLEEAKTAVEKAMSVLAQKYQKGKPPQGQ